MPRFAVVAIASIGLLFAAPAAGAGTDQPSWVASAESAMFSEINKVRSHRGRRTLKRSEALGDSSRSYAQFMARNRVWRHARNKSTRGYCDVREILARHTDPPTRVRNVIRMWMNSSTHRSTLLGGSRWAGVGVARGRLNGRKYTYWVVRFARRC